MNTPLTLPVCEIFYGLQGETSLAGLPFVFVRLVGCNLRCRYCDSTHAYTGGTKMTVTEIVKEATRYPTQHVLLTGGEPLIHTEATELARALATAGMSVSIETNGETPIAPVAPFCRIVMDIKTPSSGVEPSRYRENLPLLKRSDEIKFVIGDEHDYAWAKRVVSEIGRPCDEILFSPAFRDGAEGQEFLRWLAESIIKDRLAVRLQVQLHKLIWGPDRKGV